MALDKKGGFGLDLEAQFKNAPHVAEVKPADTHTHTYTDTDAHTHTEENKTKRTYGLVQQAVFDTVTAYAKANKTSYNAIVCDLLNEFIKEKGL
jgi:hypothetical protein